MYVGMQNKFKKRNNNNIDVSYLDIIAPEGIQISEYSGYLYMSTMEGCDHLRCRGSSFTS